MTKCQYVVNVQQCSLLHAIGHHAIPACFTCITTFSYSHKSQIFPAIDSLPASGLTPRLYDCRSVSSEHLGFYFYFSSLVFLFCSVRQIKLAIYVSFWAHVNLRSLKLKLKLTSQAMTGVLQWLFHSRWSPADLRTVSDITDFHNIFRTHLVKLAIGIQ